MCFITLHVLEPPSTVDKLKQWNYIPENAQEFLLIEAFILICYYTASKESTAVCSLLRTHPQKECLSSCFRKLFSVYQHTFFYDKEADLPDIWQIISNVHVLLHGLSVKISQKYWFLPALLFIIPLTWGNNDSLHSLADKQVTSYITSFSSCLRI